MVVVPSEPPIGRRRAVATITIVLINVLVYIYTSFTNLFMSSTNESIFALGFIPALIYSDPIGGVLRIFTSMFTHADLFHIFFNMYFLWVFGQRVESLIGTRRFVALYFLSGLSAALFHLGFIPVGGYDALTIPAVGASGAISGILGAYLLLFPHTRLVVCMFFFLLPYCIPLSASAFLLIWFAEQVIYGFMRLGGVAYFAHIGGFIGGLVLIWILGRRPAEMAALRMEYLHSLFRSLGIIVSRPRGLGLVTKLVLSAFIIAAFIGFVYSFYSTTLSPIEKPLVYQLTVTANNETNLLSLTIYRERAETSAPISDGVRLLLNRIGNVIVNPTLANREINTILTYQVTISGVKVPVIINIAGVYDDAGVLKQGSGVMDSRVVLVNVAQGGGMLGSEIRIRFDIEARRISPELVLGPASALSALIALMALIPIRKSDEIVLLSRGEQTPFSYY